MDRVDFLREHLVRLLEVKLPYTVHIYGDLDSKRPIVSEISITDGWGGSSFMRGDGEPLTLALCAASEDVLRSANIEPFQPEGWESELDERAEAIEMLERVIAAMQQS
jgi:hypothetical protein